jgi:hypothetical protein
MWYRKIGHLRKKIGAIVILTKATLSPPNWMPLTPCLLAVAALFLALAPNIPGPRYKDSTPYLSALAGASKSLQTSSRIEEASF